MTPDLKHSYRAGLENVFLLNGYERIEGPFGAAYRYRDSTKLDEAVCFALVLKPGRLNADEVTYLRLRADWRQDDLAQRLHVSTQAVSLWERNEVRIPAATDLLFRARFVDEAPARRKPKIKVRGLWRQLDSLVRQVQDFNYVGCWNNDRWSFTYELRGSAFVPESESQAEIAPLLRPFQENMNIGRSALAGVTAILVSTTRAQRATPLVAREPEADYGVSLLAANEIRTVLTGNEIVFPTAVGPAAARSDRTIKMKTFGDLRVKAH